MMVVMVMVMVVVVFSVVGHAVRCDVVAHVERLNPWTILSGWTAQDRNGKAIRQVRT